MTGSPDGRPPASHMKRTAFVIVNAGSGSGHDAAFESRLRALCADAGLSAEIRLAADGDALAAAIRAGIDRRPDVIVAGGGDGTVSAVAAALAGGDIALGVLPLGTLNHFAHDLGIPDDLQAAVAVLAGGHEAHVDVGEVNGRVFINNSSIGLYADIVRLREHQQHRLGRSKWLASLFSAITALRRYPFLGVRLSVGGVIRLQRTPFIFVGNNEYEVAGFAIGHRSRLDSGCLSVYFARRPGRRRLLMLALRALLGRLRQARDFEALTTDEIVIESRHGYLRVAADGELTMMKPPLRYRTRPAALKVVRADTSSS